MLHFNMLILWEVTIINCSILTLSLQLGAKNVFTSLDYSEFTLPDLIKAQLQVYYYFKSQQPLVFMSKKIDLTELRTFLFF